MKLRRFSVALAVVSALGGWGCGRSSNAPAPSADPIPVESGSGASRDAAFARYRANQTTQWRYVVIGNNSSDR